MVLPDNKTPAGASGDDNQTEYSVDEQAVDEAEQILTVVYEERYVREQQNENLPDVIREAREMVDEMEERPRVIGQNLAQLGDEIMHRYSHRFDDLVEQFYNSADANRSTFERFQEIAMHLFDGEINAGRVLALIFFGYRLAIHKLTDTTFDFFRLIIKWVVKFLVQKRFFDWVRNQGGWTAALTAMATASATTSIQNGYYLLGGAIFVSIAAFLYMRSKK